MNQKQFLEMLSTMPPLRHTLPGQPFDIDRSEVVAWIMAQSGFKQWVASKVLGSRRVAYDAATGKWSGVERREKRIKEDIPADDPVPPAATPVPEDEL